MTYSVSVNLRWFSNCSEDCYYDQFLHSVLWSGNPDRYLANSVDSYYSQPSFQNSEDPQLFFFLTFWFHQHCIEGPFYKCMLIVYTCTKEQMTFKLFSLIDSLLCLKIFSSFLWSSKQCSESLWFAKRWALPPCPSLSLTCPPYVSNLDFNSSETE